MKPLSSCFTPNTMATELLTILFTISSSFLQHTNASPDKNAKQPEIQGLFVFGSSLVDNGNNNFLRNSTARADYPPYGIDFPLGPSGRFSNGRNLIDALGEHLHLPSLIPPFSDPKTKGNRIIHGVNFASGGSGILDQTGSVTGEVTNLNKQIRNFKRVTLPDLKAQLLFNIRHGHLSKYLFVVGTGGNDYLLNYFNSNTNRRQSLSNFTTRLIVTLEGQLKKLYGLGARKFVLFSIQAMGCTPVVRASLHANNGSCVEAMNEAVVVFNSRLRQLVHGAAKADMPGSRMVFVDSYKIIRDIIDDPAGDGFSDTCKACCDVSLSRGDGNGILCRRQGRACGDRKAHVFFDGLHPTDAVNVKIAHKAFSSELESEVYPTNVKSLASM